MSLPERPRVRPVEAFPVEIRKGEKAIVLRDPLGVTEGMVALPPAVFALVAMFDGKKTVVDVQAEWARRTGELLFAEQIERFLRQLDEVFLLEGERFERARKEMERRFHELEVREAAHAGGAYPAEPARLREFLGDLWTRAGGPGALPGTATGTDRSLVGIVAPHIDPTRGNTAYAWAFDEVAKAGGADLYVIFGTAHQGGEDLYIFTKKDFETPLGTVATDRAFVERLETRLGGRPLDRAELSHRTEHSVEFEVLFLKYVEERLGRRASPRIVPFICSSFHEFTETGRSPAGRPEVRATIDALREEIALERARGTRVCCIAGADLAHIGIKFGHTRFADAAFRRECEEKDRASLEKAVRSDGEGFFGALAAEKDERNICGLPCMYTMMKVIEPDVKKGSLLAYGQADDPVAGSVVSFASVGYYG
ncbi:MAG TPA: AmmeMemoRadiSam system protein B [Planctomycetota bacterium]|nr:AmmeMemoRadiSam system protein B [Planctomycetota bacterium]